MEQVSVRDAKPGMVLAKPIIDKQGRTIVKAGAALTQLYISRLAKWGVTELFVEGAEDQRAPADEPQASSAPVAAGAGEPGDSDPERPAEEPEAGPRAARPPGVYRGADLEDVIDRCFSNVAGDPLMAALCAAVKDNLLPPRRGGS